MYHIHLSGCAYSADVWRGLQAGAEAAGRRAICDRERRRGPPVPLAADATSLRALPPGYRQRRRGRLEPDTVGNPQPPPA
jgi:hypothetical protein